MKNKSVIMTLVVISCIVMGVVDAVMRLGYIVKSALKLPLFLILPIICSYRFRSKELKSLFAPTKGGIAKALLMGIVVYAIILGAYFAFRGVFDFSTVTVALTGDVGVTAQNFVWVAIYISFINSLLEEFFFRGFSFMLLKKESGRLATYIFSALAFSLYHIAMMIGWFDWPVILLAVMGLFAGGIIFNWLNEKNENIYMSWLVHMFANFAINTVGFILFGIL